jgi:hypothetical protein
MTNYRSTASTGRQLGIRKVVALSSVTEPSACNVGQSDIGNKNAVDEDRSQEIGIAIAILRQLDV